MAAVYEEQLWIAWSYAEGVHHRATIDKLACEVIEALRELAA
jgi:hypothetical protein